MYRIDTNKLRGKMAEKGYNISSLSLKLGVARPTLSSYFSKPEKTPYHILSQMAALLCDSDEESQTIFFAR